MSSPSPASQRDAVTREVGRDGARHLVRVSQVFPVDRWDVYGALSSASRLSAWLGPATGDLREGGVVELPDQGVTVRVERAEPDEAIQLGWASPSTSGHVDLRLAGTDHGTLLEVDHVLEDGEGWRTYGPAAHGIAWDCVLLCLALHLDERPVPETLRLRGLPRTADGREFVLFSARAWSEADVRSGTPTRRARESADRTAGLYLEEHPE